MKNLSKLSLIPFTIGLIPIIITGLWNSFESSVWNYLQKDKSKPLSKREEKVHNWLFDSQDEIVEFDASEFKEYAIYDRAYPDRFVVKYDENFNRIW